MREYSNCCGTPKEENQEDDLCKACGEHCEFEPEENVLEIPKD